MALKVGDKAPEFDSPPKPQRDRKKLNLSANFGKKNTCCSFFPIGVTGVCTKEMCEVSQGMNAYSSLNAEVWGISGDNPFRAGSVGRKRKRSPCRYSPIRAQGYAALTASRNDSFLPQKQPRDGASPNAPHSSWTNRASIRYAEINDDPGKLPNFER